jgi:hypothetical protein
MGKILFVIPSPPVLMRFQASSPSSPQESQCLSCEKAMEDDILGELKFVLKRILVRDDRHGWWTCMEEAAVAEDKDGIIYEDHFVNHEVFCTKPHENLLDK